MYDLEKAILNKELILLQLKEYNPNQLINFILIRNKTNIVGLGELNIINQIKWFSIKELNEVLTLDKKNESKNIVKTDCNHKLDIKNIFKTINNISSANDNISVNKIVNKKNDFNILNINNIKIKLKILINKDNKKKTQIEQIYIKKNNLFNKKKGKLSLLSLVNINNNNNNHIQTSKIRSINFNNFIDGENEENEYNNHNNKENINFYNYKSSSQKNLKKSFYKSPISNIWDANSEISNSKSNQTVGSTKQIIKNNNSKSKFNSNKIFGNKFKKNKRKNFFKLHTINNDELNKLKIKNLYQNKEKDIPYNINTFNFNERSKRDLFFTVEPNEEILHKSKHKLNNLKKINSCHNSKSHLNNNKIYNNNSLKNLKKMKNPIHRINTYSSKGKTVYNKMGSNLQTMHNLNQKNSSNNLKAQSLYEYRGNLKSSKSNKLIHHNNTSKEDKGQKMNNKNGNKHSFVVEKIRAIELSLKKNIFVSKENINYGENDDSNINYYEKIKNDFISFYNDDYIKLIKGNFSLFELNLFIEKIIELYKAYKLKYNSLYSSFKEYKKYILLYQYKFLSLSKQYSKLLNMKISMESTKNKQAIYANELNDFLFKTNQIFISGEFNKIFENLYNLNDLIFNKDYNNNSKNDIQKKKLFFIFEEICEKNEMNLNSLAKKYYHDLKKCVIFKNQLSEIKIPNCDNDSNN